jgi:hypothetical protein
MTVSRRPALLINLHFVRIKPPLYPSQQFVPLASRTLFPTHPPRSLASNPYLYPTNNHFPSQVTFLGLSACLRHPRRRKLGDAVTLNLRFLSARSVSLQRMTILYWYLQGWCIKRQKCCDLTLAQSPSTPEIAFCSVFPEQMHILNWYLQGNDIFGDKGMSHVVESWCRDLEKKSGCCNLHTSTCQFSLLHQVARILSCVSAHNRVTLTIYFCRRDVQAADWCQIYGSKDCGGNWHISGVKGHLHMQCKMWLHDQAGHSGFSHPHLQTGRYFVRKRTELCP